MLVLSLKRPKSDIKQPFWLTYCYASALLLCVISHTLVIAESLDVGDEYLANLNALEAPAGMSRQGAVLAMHPKRIQLLKTAKKPQATRKLMVSSKKNDLDPRKVHKEKIVVKRPPRPPRPTRKANFKPRKMDNVTITTPQPKQVKTSLAPKSTQPPESKKEMKIVSPTSMPNKAKKAGVMSRQELEEVLDIPGVKCGTVPVYKSKVGRSINETFDESLLHEDSGAVRILHGLDSVVGEWPWIVRLLHCHGDESCETCTGTLLNDNWVLTAGHCADAHNQPTEWTAFFGLYDLVEPDESSFSVKVSKIVLHEEYNNLQNDISLMKLENPIKFSELVQPACLVPPLRNTLKFTERKKCYTVGYGLGEDRQSVERLQKLEIRTREPSACNSNSLDSVRLRPNTICIGPSEGHIGGSCSGDSGGPDLCYDPKEDRWELFGTVSYGPRVCDRDDDDQWLTVSVDLANYRTWILSTIAAN